MPTANSFPHAQRVRLPSASDNPIAAGSVLFCHILDEIRALHLKKGADYGTKDDVFANIRASEGIGVPAWKGAWLRARDKVQRIDSYCLNGKLENEGVEDSFMDLAAYSIICLLLFREAQYDLRHGGKLNVCSENTNSQKSCDRKPDTNQQV